MDVTQNEFSSCRLPQLRGDLCRSRASAGNNVYQFGFDLRAEQVGGAADGADDQNAGHHERKALRQLAPADQRLGDQVQENADQYRADHDQDDIKQKPDQHRNEGDTKNNHRSFEEFGRGHPWPR